MKLSKRVVNWAMRSRSSSKPKLMLGSVSAMEGAIAEERGGRIVLVESEGSKSVAILEIRLGLWSTKGSVWMVVKNRDENVQMRRIPLFTLTILATTALMWAYRAAELRLVCARKTDVHYRMSWAIDHILHSLRGGQSATSHHIAYSYFLSCTSLQ